MLLLGEPLRTNRLQMDDLTGAPTVLGSDRARENAVLRPGPGETISCYKADYERRKSNLRGDHYTFNFTACSLQKRLLDYFETEFGLINAAGLLQAAERDRQALRNSIWESTLTGLHPRNRDLSPLIEGFTEFELFVLNEVVTSGDPDSALMAPEVIAVVARKLAQGDGAKFITYVSKRLELQNTKKRPELVNYVVQIIVRMWTNPDHPLWISPSAGASKYISKITKRRLTNEGFTRLAATRKLQRIPTEYLDRLFSVDLVDPVGLDLRDEFAETCDFDIDEVRRGRRKKG